VSLGFSYRTLVWTNDAERGETGSPVILKGVFDLTPDDPEKLRKEAVGIVRRRKERQPSWLPSAGCFFKNPPGNKPAGMLIDLAGLKGKTVGGAEISARHANFIVNRKNASAADIITLKELVQETVKNKFDIDLEPEVKIVGD
jgi:UDP-N-acetylmuramate dehydrogenase